MAKLQVFQYRVIYTPEEDTDIKPVEKAAIIATGELLAPSSDKALLQIARLIPEKYVALLDQVEILIRPF